MDVSSADAAIDASRPECRTDLDCANGNACDGEERCVDSVCVEGAPILCEDEDACDGLATCDSATGRCVVVPAGPCDDDGDPCNGVERCDAALGCVAGPAPDCDDGIECTADSCITGMGCAHLPEHAACDAASGGLCQAGGCVYPTCEDGVTCITEDPCFQAHCEGGCVRVPLNCPDASECCNGECVAIGCDDGNECTDDRCGRRRGCMHDPRASGCSDGNPCTLGDVCVAGACRSGPRRPCISVDGGMCIGGSCDDATGACTTVPLSGVSCVDTNYCTINDVCVAGVCTSGSAAADCDDGETCTADMCDVSTGCTHVPVRDGITCPGIIASICIGGRCFGDLGCEDGRTDCDEDGICECDGTCAGRRCTTAVDDCNTVDRCTTGQSCCAVPGSPAYGTCVATACLGCCM